MAQIKPLHLRLTKHSATYVQCIHTDSDIIGTRTRCGHQDFFPNGGATPQPGCIFSPFRGGLTMSNYFFKLTTKYNNY